MKDLLTSRKFWALVVGIAILVVAQFQPGFDLDTEGAAALLVIAVSYLIGAAVDPGPGGWRGVVLSRKFWAAVIGLVFVVTDALGIKMIFTGDQLVEVILLIAGYIVSVAVEKPKNLKIAGIVVGNRASLSTTTKRAGKIDTRDVPR